MCTWVNQNAHVHMPGAHAQLFLLGVCMDRVERIF